MGATVAAGTILGAALLLSALVFPSQENRFEQMAATIVRALKVTPGERVMLRLDPRSMPELEPVARAALERAGAKVETLPYWPGGSIKAARDARFIFTGPTARARSTPRRPATRPSTISCTSTR
jgi:hypothetical protein